MGAWSWLVELVRGPAVAPGGVRSDWAGAVLGYPVRVTPGRDTSHARFEVGGAPASLRVSRRNGVDELLRAALITGDRALDAVACIEGDRASALALLHPGVRAALVDAVRHGLVLRDGVVRGEALKAVVPDLVTRAAELVRMLAQRDGPADPLVERFTIEPVGAVRVQILRALLDAGGPDAACVAAEALDDEDAEVRLLAARWGQNAGALASLVVDPSAPSRVRDLAFQQLRQTDRGALVAGLCDALGDPARSLFALERAAAAPDPRLLEPILERGRALLDDEAGLIAEGPALLRALEGHDSESVAPLLLGLLEAAPLLLARRALLLLRTASPQGLLEPLKTLQGARPELAAAIAEAREHIEARTGGEVLAKLLALEWQPRSRAAVGARSSLLHK